MLLNRTSKAVRNHSENKALILGAIRAYETRGTRRGATTLNVMYQVYLSYNRTQYYLTELLQGRMIERDVGTKNYMLTEKGTQYLTAYYDLDSILDTDNGCKATHESN